MIAPGKRWFLERSGAAGAVMSGYLSVDRPMDEAGFDAAMSLSWGGIDGQQGDTTGLLLARVNARAAGYVVDVCAVPPSSTAALLNKHRAVGPRPPSRVHAGSNPQAAGGSAGPRSPPRPRAPA